MLVLSKIVSDEGSVYCALLVLVLYVVHPIYQFINSKLEEKWVANHIDETNPSYL